MGKGWDRASFDFRVRPNKVARDVSRQDLMVPTDGSRLRLAALCVACGVMISLLWVWTTLMLVTLLGFGPGRWFYPIVGASALVVAVVLYVFTSWDFERQSRWGREA